ncbi:MAG TPA: hypothetical protein VF331_03600 [Polyangiales bacterium]
MFGDGVSEQRARRAQVAFFGLSLALHIVLFLGVARRAEVDDKPLFHLPTSVEFGVSEQEPGGGEKGPAPPAPAPAVPRPAAKAHKAIVKSEAITIPVDAGTPDGPADAAASDASAVAARSGDGGEPEDELAEGPFGGGDGDGTGGGPGGDGSGAYAPKGATIALNVDLERVRQSALTLETEALLGIIPQWELLLAGSGLDSSKDLTRVFVASPNLERSSLVVSARHGLSRARIDEAVARLAAERGQKAPWATVRGFAVAPWWNRGPTKRVIALTADDQLTITRTEDLKRVLSVARALAKARVREGWKQEEVNKQGGLLAMQEDEAVALWVEGVRRYVPTGEAAVPLSLRMSVHRVDQFHTELRATGRYESVEQAQAALEAIEALRKQLIDNPRVMFLGLQNAVQLATLEQDKQSVVLRMTLTLHQTRYLLQYVSAVLKPRDAAAAAP